MTKVAKALVEVRNPGLRSEGTFSRREEGWELGEAKVKEKGVGQELAGFHPQLITIFVRLAKVGNQCIDQNGQMGI